MPASVYADYADQLKYLGLFVIETTENSSISVKISRICGKKIDYLRLSSYKQHQLLTSNQSRSVKIIGSTIIVVIDFPFDRPGCH